MDSEYLKRTIGPSLVRCLAEVCAKQPADPIEYIALWLCKEYVNKKIKKQEEEDEAELVKQREQYKIAKERECERRKEVKRIKMEQAATRKAAQEREIQRVRDEEAARLLAEEEEQEEDEDEEEMDEESSASIYVERDEGRKAGTEPMSRVIEEEKGDDDDDESVDSIQSTD